MTDDPRIDPADLRNVRFPGSSRRYDARSVDQFLETVAARIEATNALVDELRQQLADAHAASAAPRPAPAADPSDLSLLDDEALVRLVGEETASVLATARRAAEEIRGKAEEAAARMIREATAEADRVDAEARQRSAELTAEAEQVLERATDEATEAAARIRQEADDEAARTLAESREAADAQRAELDARRTEVEAEAEAILEQARDEGRAMLAEARDVRARVLDDLQRRRDIARDHIERLLAGRERLLAAYDKVRENLDDITGQLADALPDPGEPELPDGFAGIVGPSGADGSAAGDEVAGDVDDTVVVVICGLAPAQWEVNRRRSALVEPQDCLGEVLLEVIDRYGQIDGAVLLSRHDTQGECVIAGGVGRPGSVHRHWPSTIGPRVCQPRTIRAASWQCKGEYILRRGQFGLGLHCGRSSHVGALESCCIGQREVDPRIWCYDAKSGVVDVAVGRPIDHHLAVGENSVREASSGCACLAQNLIARRVEVVANCLDRKDFVRGGGCRQVLASGQRGQVDLLLHLLFACPRIPEVHAHRGDHEQHRRHHCCQNCDRTALIEPGRVWPPCHGHSEG